MTDAVWTETMIAALREMWDRGDKSGDIAKAIGVTKNSVISKVHRLDLAARPSPIRRAPAGEAAPTRAERSAARAIENALAPKAEPPPKPERLPPEGCRWPMWGFGKVPTHVYCGSPRPDALLPYCAKHHAEAFTPSNRLLAA